MDYSPAAGGQLGVVGFNPAKQRPQTSSTVSPIADLPVLIKMAR
jgi:hypothetical protein